MITFSSTVIKTESLKCVRECVCGCVCMDMRVRASVRVCPNACVAPMIHVLKNSNLT